LSAFREKDNRGTQPGKLGFAREEEIVEPSGQKGFPGEGGEKGSRRKGHRGNKKKDLEGRQTVGGKETFTTLP